MKILENCKADILGTEWTIEFRDKEDDPCLTKNDGYADDSTKLIVVDKMMQIDLDSKKDLYSYKQQVLRHEIIHAFLSESGISSNSHKSESWATDEEIIDWFAIQSPKIVKAFKEAGCI